VTVQVHQKQCHHRYGSEEVYGAERGSNPVEGTEHVEAREYLPRSVHTHHLGVLMLMLRLLEAYGEGGVH
jgi:hypothetical protein